jgi:hypothetical protein
VPDTTGTAVATGADTNAATADVALDVADADPVTLVAVTTQRMVSPT